MVMKASLFTNSSFYHLPSSEKCNHKKDSLKLQQFPYPIKRIQILLLSKLSYGLLRPVRQKSREQSNILSSLLKKESRRSYNPFSPYTGGIRDFLDHRELGLNP